MTGTTKMKCVVCGEHCVFSDLHDECRDLKPRLVSGDELPPVMLDDTRVKVLRSIFTDAELKVIEASIRARRLSIESNSRAKHAFEDSGGSRRVLTRVSTIFRMAIRRE